MTLNDLHDYLRKQYGAEGTKEYREDPGILVFARPDNGKWFAATKNIRCSSVDVAGDGRIDILNVRLDPRVVASLGTRGSYHAAASGGRREHHVRAPSRTSSRACA